MNQLRLLANEARLLRRSLFTWAAPVLTVALTVVGMHAVDQANDMQFHGMGRTAFTMALGAAQYGALAGAALFAMLTLLVLSRDRRQQSRAILDAAAGHGHILAARIAVLLGLACVTAVLALGVTALVHPAMTASGFELMPYLFSIGLVLLPALCLGVLFAATLEFLFQDLDVAFLSFADIYMMGLGASSYQFRWVQSTASVYSDFAGIEPVGRLVAYNRLFWLCAALGAFLLSLLLRRGAGLSFRASVARNAGRGVLPLAAATALVAAAWVYAREPFLFPGDSALKATPQRTQDAWLETVECNVQLEPEAKTLAANVRYVFGKKPPALPLEFITNTGLEIESLEINGARGSWDLHPGTDRMRVVLPAGERCDLVVRYRGCIRYPTPAGFPGYITDQSVYLLENSHWLFEPLVAPRQTIRVLGTVRAPSRLTVVTPGKVDAITDDKTSKTWRFVASSRGLSVGLFAAEYEREVFNAGTATVELYFSPRHARFIRESGLTGHIRQMIEFYETTLGPYPFEGMPLRIAETSVYKPGGHSSLNVVTLAEYLLNRDHVPNPEREPRYILRDLKILAHELAHQWWGGGVAITGAGGWSSEGLAEYCAYKYLCSRYPEGITHNLARGWQTPDAGRRSAYYQKDAAALERMRPALRERLLREEEKGRAYGSLPALLLAGETRIGDTELRRRLAAAFQQGCGRNLTWSEFHSVMGTDALGEGVDEP